MYLLSSHHTFKLFIILFLACINQAIAKDPHSFHQWKVDDVLLSDSLPFAIGHRGYGDNKGEDADRPIENTAPSATRAFREGVQIIEVDVVMTQDKQIIALHDDYLEDFTCVNSLELKELKKRLAQVSTLKRILQTAHPYSQKGHSERQSGQVIIEIKTPSPLCDPTDSTTPELVNIVLQTIRQMKMEEQVLIESFSPEILALSKAHEPAIQTMLTLSLLQLLPVEQIEAITGLDVSLIDKNAGFNLQWAEIGPLFRLPGYLDISEYVQTLLLTDSRSASLDSLFLAQAEQSQPGAGSGFIDQLHLLGLSALVYTIDTEEEWSFIADLGADGIYTNNIPLGLSLEEQ